jgi:hypothetical protein
VSARALTRASVLAAAAGCASPQAGPPLAGETIAGRALVDGRVVLLTTAPALITVDLDARTLARTPIPRHASAPALWGLGEAGGALYTIAGFSDLMRVDAGGHVRHAARFNRPMGNLLDTPDGMAAQAAVDSAGTALVWDTDTSARLSAMGGRLRDPLALSRAEESALHLLSCSTPPDVLCWLPGSNELLTIAGNQVSAMARLDTVSPIAPARLIEQPTLRTIQDAISTSPDTLIVLFRRPDEGARLVVGEFDAAGRQRRTLTPAEPLRLLLGVREGRVVALAASGRLTEVPL